MIARGPFEVWLSPIFSDGWKPRVFYRLQAKRVNRFGPPPHGIQLSWMRLHLVIWYRDREAPTAPGFGQCEACGDGVERVGWDTLCFACQESEKAEMEPYDEREADWDEDE